MLVLLYESRQYTGTGTSFIPVLEQIRSRLINYCPTCVEHSGGDAGVLAVLTSNGEVVLGKRSDRLRTHPGEMALPGGQREDLDASIVDTALREAYEEIGLDSGGIEVLGQLSQRISRWGLRVTPMVALDVLEQEYTADGKEFQQVFRVPLAALLEHAHDYSTHYERDGESLYVPVWHWQEQRIWGLTSIILSELLNVCLDAEINLSTPPKKEILQMHGGRK